jgi:hypothetical protein
MVTQAETVDVPLLVADTDRAVDCHVLLVVAARKTTRMVIGQRRAVVVHRLAAVHR